MKKIPALTVTLLALLSQSHAAGLNPTAWSVNFVNTASNAQSAQGIIGNGPTNGLTAAQVGNQVSTSNFVSTTTLPGLMTGYPALGSSVFELLTKSPVVGSTRSQTWRGRTTSQGQYFQGGGNFDVGLLYLASGTGIVRSIHWVGFPGKETDWSLRTNLQLRVYVDGGTTVNATNPAGRLVVQAPLTTLFGNKYRTNTGWYSWNSRYLNVQDLYGTADNGKFGFMLHTLMPFTNGIYVGMFSSGTNAIWNYSEVRYELGPLAFPFSHYRLHADYVSTNVTWQGDFDTNYLAGFLNVSNTTGGGALLGVLYSIAGTTDLSTWPEGDFKFFTDMPGGLTWAQTLTYACQTIGGEDLAGNSFYFARGEEQKYDYGTTYMNSAQGNRVEGYRWYGPTEAMRWKTNIIGAWTKNNGITNMLMDFLSFYYAP